MGNFTFNGTWWVFIWEIPLYRELAFFPIENGRFYQWEKTSAKVREFPARHLASCQRSEQFPPRVSDVRSIRISRSTNQSFFSRLALLGLPHVDLRLEAARTTLTSPVRQCCWPLRAKPPMVFVVRFFESRTGIRNFRDRHFPIAICMYLYDFMCFLHFY